MRHCHGWRTQTLQLSDGSLLLPLYNPSLFLSSIFTWSLDNPSLFYLPFSLGPSLTLPFFLSPFSLSPFFPFSLGPAITPPFFFSLHFHLGRINVLSVVICALFIWRKFSQRSGLWRKMKNMMYAITLLFSFHFQSASPQLFPSLLFTIFAQSCLKVTHAPF